MNGETHKKLTKYSVRGTEPHFQCVIFGQHKAWSLVLSAMKSMGPQSLSAPMVRNVGALAQPLLLGLQRRVRGVEAHVEEEGLLRRSGLAVLPHPRQSLFSQSCHRWSKMLWEIHLQNSAK